MNETTKRLHASFTRYMGPEFSEYLDRSDTEEFSVSSSGIVSLNTRGRSLRQVGVMEPSKAAAIVDMVAGAQNKIVDINNPNVDARLPWDGSRFAALVPPAVSVPAFSIRKHGVTSRTLDDYVAEGTLTSAQMQTLKSAVNDMENILVIGGTRSGKTTLANTVIAEMCTAYPDSRTIIIEDLPEIQCNSKFHQSIVTTEHLSMTDAIRACMRLDPDRIIIGEVRGPEALDLLQAWDSGHPGGICTLHANNARSGLGKLERYISGHPHCPTIGLRDLIADTVQVVVSIAQTPQGRRVREVLRVEGYSPETGYQTVNI